MHYVYVCPTKVLMHIYHFLPTIMSAMGSLPLSPSNFSPNIFYESVRPNLAALFCLIEGADLVILS